MSLLPRIAALLSVPKPLGGVYSDVRLLRLELAECNWLIVFAKSEGCKTGPKRIARRLRGEAINGDIEHRHRPLNCLRVLCSLRNLLRRGRYAGDRIHS